MEAEDEGEILSVIFPRPGAVPNIMYDGEQTIPIALLFNYSGKLGSFAPSWVHYGNDNIIAFNTLNTVQKSDMILPLRVNILRDCSFK